MQTPTRPPPPRHAAPARPRGRPEALDLINSEELDGCDGVLEEHLPTVDDAIAFFTRAGSRTRRRSAPRRIRPGGGRVARAPVCRVTPCARTPRSGGRTLPRRSTPNALREAPRSSFRAAAGGAPAHRGRPDGRGPRARDRATRRGDRHRRPPDSASAPTTPAVGVRGPILRRPAPVVRHDLVREPREGPALSVEAEAADAVEPAAAGGPGDVRSSPPRAAAGPRSRTRHRLLS